MNQPSCIRTMDSRVPPLHPEGHSGQNDDRATGKGTGPPKGVASEMWEVRKWD